MMCTAGGSAAQRSRLPSTALRPFIWVICPAQQPAAFRCTFLKLYVRSAGNPWIQGSAVVRKRESSAAMALRQRKWLVCPAIVGRAIKEARRRS